MDRVPLEGNFVFSCVQQDWFGGVLCLILITSEDCGGDGEWWWYFLFSWGGSQESFHRVPEFVSLRDPLDEVQVSLTICCSRSKAGKKEQTLEEEFSKIQSFASVFDTDEKTTDGDESEWGSKATSRPSLLFMFTCIPMQACLCIRWTHQQE